MASVMHPSAGMFSERCFLFRFWHAFFFSVEFHCALLLVHVGETVCGSHLCQVLVLWLNDCLPLLLVIFVKQPGESPQFGSVLFHTEGCSLFMPCSSGLVKLMSGELCSCFVVVLHVCICASCTCAILAWLTASCSSCCWLFHPECIACVCCSRLIFLQFSSANFLKTSQLAFLEFQLGLWNISGGVFWHSIVRKMVVTSSCFFVHFSARYFGYIIGSEWLITSPTHSPLLHAAYNSRFLWLGLIKIITCTSKCYLDVWKTVGGVWDTTFKLKTILKAMMTVKSWISNLTN